MSQLSLTARVASRVGAAVAVAAALSATVFGVARADNVSDTIGELVAAATGRLDAPAPARAAQPLPPPPQIVFVSPVADHEVVSPFGLRQLPWEAHGRLHAGVDIAAPTGTAVRATAAGTVTKAGVSPSYGRYVEVAHADGLTSFYAHLSRADARVGDALAAGAVIGRVGNTGDSTGPHLHFEIRQARAPLNPALFVDRSFATAADLPIAQAAQVPASVRIAHVSRIPASKVGVRRLASGRVHGVVQMGT